MLGKPFVIVKADDPIRKFPREKIDEEEEVPDYGSHSLASLKLHLSLTDDLRLSSLVLSALLRPPSYLRFARVLASVSSEHRPHCADAAAANAAKKASAEPVPMRSEAESKELRELALIIGKGKSASMTVSSLLD